MERLSVIINEHITVKLVDSKTVIYVKGKVFNQCKYLLINIPDNEIYQYDEIDSIDEAIDIYKTYATTNRNNLITPEVAFWGHCSNLQAWVEHNYDTRILHSNLSFPLLRKLVDVGDPKALKVLKDEVAKRVESGYPSTIVYLLEQGFFDILSDQEIIIIIEDTDIIDFMINYRNHRIWEQVIYKIIRNNPEILRTFILKAIMKKNHLLEYFINTIRYTKRILLSHVLSEILYDIHHKKIDITYESFQKSINFTCASFTVDDLTYLEKNTPYIPESERLESSSCDPNFLKLYNEVIYGKKFR